MSSSTPSPCLRLIAHAHLRQAQEAVHGDVRLLLSMECGTHIPTSDSEREARASWIAAQKILNVVYSREEEVE